MASDGEPDPDATTASELDGESLYRGCRLLSLALWTLALGIAFP